MKISKGDDDSPLIVIKNINNNETVVITDKQLKYMSLPYSNTCHSSQGLTIGDPYTIFDANTAYTDRRWIYTAITRCKTLDQITIFEHSKRECDILTQCRMKQYFELKIENYINQDITAGRIKRGSTNELMYKGRPVNDYIDYEWIKNNDQQCYLCSEMFDIELIDSNVRSNMTVDRVSSSHYHSKSNCKLCCNYCNASKRNL
jgi:hypothetical protein